MSKISLNPKYTNNSGNSWSTTTYNSLEYHISTNKTSSSVSTLKCEFTTPYDNIDVVIEIGSSSEKSFDWCYIGKLDNSNPSYSSNYLDRISGREYNENPVFKTVTINVDKAGTHFLIIGYSKDGSGSYGNDCGYFRLVTTEVDSMEPTKYIYCGTKTTVSEEPIKFTKTNVSYGSEGNRNWSEYQGSNKDYLWETSTGDSGYKTAKISFTTLSDNTIVTLKYNVYWRFTDEEFTVSELDSTKSFISEYGPCNKKVTKEITVPKAGEHFITIGYKSAYFSGTYVYVGFSGTNVVKNVKTLVPESIFANNKKIGKVYVGSELIWGKSILNTISWETLTWDQNNNTYTYNSKGPLKMNYKNLGSSTSYSISLNTSPAEMPNNGQIDNITFDNGQSGSIQIMPYKIDLSDWDSSFVTNMGFMFRGCSSLTSLGVSKLNISKVTNMGNMFYGCSSLTSLDVSKWNTSSVTNMASMFYNCGKLTSLDVSNLNVGNVTNMASMFYNCGKLTSLDVSNLNVGNVTNMASMFRGCSSLTSLDVSKWNISKVTNMGNMFYGCSSLTSFSGSNLNVGNVTNMGFMFYGCSSLTSLDVSKWNVSSVTNMASMFYGCSSLTSLDVSKWNISKVTNMGNMFYGCSKLTSLIDGHESEPNVVALNGLKVNLDLHYSTKLNYESVYALFRGAAKVTTTKTITLPKVMQGKLDADKVKIATDKGWKIAYK